MYEGTLSMFNRGGEPFAGGGKVREQIGFRSILQVNDFVFYLWIIRVQVIVWPFSLILGTVEAENPRKPIDHTWFVECHITTRNVYPGIDWINSKGVIFFPTNCSSHELVLTNRINEIQNARTEQPLQVNDYDGLSSGDDLRPHVSSGDRRPHVSSGDRHANNGDDHDGDRVHHQTRKRHHRQGTGGLSSSSLRSCASLALLVRLHNSTSVPRRCVAVLALLLLRSSSIAPVRLEQLLVEEQNSSLELSIGDAYQYY